VRASVVTQRAAQCRYMPYVHEIVQRCTSEAATSEEPLRQAGRRVTGAEVAQFGHRHGAFRRKAPPEGEGRVKVVEGETTGAPVT